MGASVDLGPADERAELEAEVTTASSAGAGSCSDRGGGDARCRGHVARRARPQRRSPGIAVVVDASMADVLWIPADVLADDAVRAALGSHTDLRGHNVEAADALAAGVRRRGAGPHARHGDRRLPHRPGRGPLHAARPHREVHEVRPAVRRRRRQWPARPRRHVARRRRAGRPRCARRRPRSPSRSWPSMEAQGMAELYRDDREPAGAACSPRWSTSASGSTSTSCAALGKRLSDEVQTLQAQLREVGGPRRPQPQLAEAAARDPLRRAWAWRRGRRPRPATPPTPRRSRSSRTSGPSSSSRCCATARSRSCAPPTARACSPRSAADGRIHATFNQTVARTGRLSSDQPNLHNIPVRTEEGRQFRKAFVPGAGLPSCWSPTTTRSSCAASPTSPRTPG